MLQAFSGMTIRQRDKTNSIHKLRGQQQMTDENIFSGQTFHDHLLIFGSTGLIGSLTLEELLKVELYLDHGKDLQLKLSSFDDPNVNHFTLNKYFYCVNRQLSNEKRSHTNEYLMERCKASPLIYMNQEYFLNSNTSSSPPASQSSNPSLGNNVFEEDGKIHNIPSVDNCLRALDYRINKRSYQLEYISRNHQSLLITFHFTVVQLILEDSTKWAELLPNIFSNEIKLSSESETFEDHVQLTLPHLNQVETMICTLGANASSYNQNNHSRYFVDYHLTFQIAKTFACCEGKRLVIITSFNNPIISHIFPYFRTKCQLENDLQNNLTPALKQIVFLRPGPLVGHHANPEERNARLRYSPTFTGQLKHYREWCWEYKKSLAKEIRKIGLRTKASELVAGAMYRKPGSTALGYCVPASKTAYATAYMATNPTTGAMRIVTSKEIDHLT